MQLLFIINLATKDEKMFVTIIKVSRIHDKPTTQVKQKRIKFTAAKSFTSKITQINQLRKRRFYSQQRTSTVSLCS